MEITVVDTPGLGMETPEESESTETIVETLKKVEYVHAFAMLYNGREAIRKTRERLAVFRHYSNIFGKDFGKNVIIVATHWGYDENSKYQREGIGIKKDEDWLISTKKNSGFDELEHGNQIQAIYFDPYDLTLQENLRQNTYDNLKKLYNWASENEPFHCQDIEAIKDEYLRAREEQDRIRAMLDAALLRNDQFEKCKKERNETQVELKKCTQRDESKIQTGQTKMIGLGIGCTV